MPTSTCKRTRPRPRTEILSKKFTPLVLAKQPNTDAINLVATIPANEGAVVHVNRTGTKGASVHLKITNK